MLMVQCLCGVRVLHSAQLAQRSCRELSGLSHRIAPTKLFGRLIAYIDEVTGATEIRDAHHRIMQNERELQDAQVLRRNKRDELDTLHARMKQIHGELDKFSRGDDKYLCLLTEEHAVIKNEQTLLTEVRRADEAEKAAFDNLSNTLRASYAKEQEHAGRIKTWTVIASTIGALFGIVGAWVANEIKMRRIKELIPNAAALGPLIQDISKLVNKQQNEVTEFIKEVREIMHLKEADDLAQVSTVRKDSEMVTNEKLVKLLQEQNSVISKELDEVKRLIALELNLQSENPNVVYVGSDMEQLLSQSEKNIESKMKLQTLVEVVFLYTLITVSIPLIYAFFKGG